MGLYHGISIRDAAATCHVPEQTIRKWLSRGNIPRTTDGQIDPFQLIEWWDTIRDADKGKRNPVHQARHNPYADPSCTISEAG